MIKIESTVCGTICRDAVLTTNDKGVTCLEFTLKVVLPSRSNDNMAIEIPVSVKDGKRDELKNYVQGNRILLKGLLHVDKKEDMILFRLTDAEPEIAYSVPSDDIIKGDMEFTGKVKDFSEKTDKRGMPYLILSASSPKKVAKDKWEYIWIHFKRFPAKGATFDTVLPDWLKEGSHVEILGDIQISTYNNRISLACRISEMELTQQQESVAEQVDESNEPF